MYNTDSDLPRTTIVVHEALKEEVEDKELLLEMVVAMDESCVGRGTW